MCDSRYQFKKTNWAQNFRPPSQCKILPPSSFRKFELISFKQSPKALKSARMYNMSNILDLGRVVLWHNFSSLRPIRFKLILAHDFMEKVAKIQSVFFFLLSFGQNKEPINCRTSTWTIKIHFSAHNKYDVENTFWNLVTFTFSEWKTSSQNLHIRNHLGQ